MIEHEGDRHLYERDEGLLRGFSEYLDRVRFPLVGGPGKVEPLGQAGIGFPPPPYG